MPVYKCKYVDVNFSLFAWKVALRRFLLWLLFLEASAYDCARSLACLTFLGRWWQAINKCYFRRFKARPWLVPPPAEVVL